MSFLIYFLPDLMCLDKEEEVSTFVPPALLALALINGVNLFCRHILIILNCLFLYNVAKA